jgi:ribosomal protein S18 acetylase RimI-like enzyme
VLPDGSTNKLITGKLSTIEEIAAQSSLILVLARDTNDGNSQAAASIELRLQPTDAKIPFSQPWLDSVERKIVRLFPFVHRNNDSSKPPMRPYLCNLCVSENLRGLGIGRALCRLVEAIACQQWGYDHLYLHVDPSNDAARILYEKEGYKDVGKRWSVIWAGGADGIGYYVKKLR